jgi:hypothetical protein
VYGVTRPGYDHCDVTEGVLLDITPLLVDGRKVVTLYDKDLTEGINLLIGKNKNGVQESAENGWPRRELCSRIMCTYYVHFG